MPASRIRPERNSGSMSAPPLQVSGVQSQCDGADDDIEQHGFRSHQALDEVGKIQGERKMAEQIAQSVGGLEILQVPDEPECEQHRNRDQGGDDLVLRQGRKELADREAGYSEQDEADVAGDDRGRLRMAE